jgi:hypothetical protein
VIPARQLARQREETLDDYVASRSVAGAVIALEQPAILACPDSSIFRASRICCARTPVARPMIDRFHALPRSRCKERRGLGREAAATGLRAAARRV